MGIIVYVHRYDQRKWSRATYIQLYSTDNRALIDHLYANLIEDVQAGTLETNFSDHKAIWASVKVMK